MKYSVFLASIISVALIGCAKDSTTPTTPPKNYLPSSTGTYYIYENTEVEKSSSGADSVVAVFSDSTTVEGTEQKSDLKGTTKTAVKYAVRADNSANIEYQYTAQEGSKLYRLINLSFDLDSANTVNLGSRWMLVYDQSNATWTAYEDSVSGITINVGGFPVPVSMKFKVTGANAGTENITVNGQSISTAHSILSIGITVYVPLFGDFPINLSIHQWLGADIGLVKSVQPPISSPSPIGDPIAIPGSSSVLLRYSINK
ncbi:MAG: hypothetical protein HYX66_00175 [Ignavibacteria bacterium]|nr:hypothetical protein [Ignavibacteria bacterium]